MCSLSLEVSSVNENIKTLRHLQQLMAAVAAAIIAFSLPHGVDAEEALSELKAVKAYDWSLYPYYVRAIGLEEDRHFTGLRIKSELKSKVLAYDACRGLAFGPGCTEVRLPFALKLPTGASTPEEYERFWAASPEVFYPQFEQLRDIPQQPAVLRLWSFVVWLTDPRFACKRFGVGDPDCYYDPVEEFSSLQGVIRLQMSNTEYESKGLGQEMALLPLSTNLTSKFYYFKSTPAEWMSTIGNPLGLTLSKDKAELNKTKAEFSKAKAFWNQIQSKPLSQAIEFLQQRKEAADKELSLLGLSVDRDVVLVAGPVLLLALLFFFIVHLEQALRASSDKNVEVFWVGGITGPRASILNLSILLLPIVAILCLQHRANLESGFGYWMMVAAVGATTGSAYRCIAGLDAFQEASRRSKRLDEFPE
jgi:hypothetical protein